MADNKAYSTYPSYPSYDPYGAYPPAVGHVVDADMGMQERRDVMMHVPEPGMGENEKRDVMSTGKLIEML